MFDMGDKVKIVSGPHEGKIGHVACNRGTPISGWMSVRTGGTEHEPMGRPPRSSPINHEFVHVSSVKLICSSLSEEEEINESKTPSAADR